MPAILVRQPNGTEWLVSHCEVVIPHGGTFGMSPNKIAKTLSYCESLSKRFAAYLRVAGSSKEYFNSVEEFERYEANPRLARTERSPRSQRASRPGVIYLAKGDGSYKIGRSSSIASREHELTTKLPFSVQIVHTIRAKDNVTVERFWHERFARRNVRGEWFSLSESEVAEFCGHTEM
jgi:hypothetical protein